MRQSTRRARRRQRQAGVSSYVAIRGRQGWRLDLPRAPLLSPRARARLAMLDWHQAHGPT